MIFGKTKHKLPKTREEYEAAMKSRLAVVIKTDIFIDDGDPLLVFIYESGFSRIKFPSGTVMAFQWPDVETAIREGREAMMSAGMIDELIRQGHEEELLAAQQNGNSEGVKRVINEAQLGSCRSPRVEVHRRPASADEVDWMRSIGMLLRFEKPDGTWTEWE